MHWHIIDTPTHTYTILPTMSLNINVLSTPVILNLIYYINEHTIILNHIHGLIIDTPTHTYIHTLILITTVLLKCTTCCVLQHECLAPERKGEPKTEGEDTTRALVI